MKGKRKLLDGVLEDHPGLRAARDDDGVVSASVSRSAARSRGAARLRAAVADPALFCGCWPALVGSDPRGRFLFFFPQEE